MLRAHAQGFTLIELGVVLVLLGLILGIAVPVHPPFTVSSRLAVGADGVVTQLYLAREKAVDEQADVTVRFAEDSLDRSPDDPVRPPPDDGVSPPRSAGRP